MSRPASPSPGPLRAPAISAPPAGPDPAPGDARRWCPTAVLVVGRAIHPPWNEGTRVTARNLARAAASLAPTAVVSVTNPAIAADDEGDPDASGMAQPGPTLHVATSQPYGIRSDYAPLVRVVRQLERIRPRRPGWVAHLVGAPLVLAPWTHLRGGRVVAHVTLTRQAYQGLPERFRAAASWRIFDRWIDAYACASPAVRDDLVRAGHAPHKVHLVPPGIDTGRFSPGARGAAREALGWGPDELVVAYIGTISPIRFPTDEVLAGLCAAAERIGRQVRLEVFAPVATHAYNLEWAETNVRRGAAGDVAVGVHLGDLGEDEKVRVYRAADALLLPFAGPVAVEPPLTLLEGMAAGAIPFVSPAANRSGIVRDGVTGFTWAGAGQLAGAIADFIASAPGDRAAIRAAAVAAVEWEYSLGATIRRLAATWAAVGLDRRAGRDGTRRGSARRGVSVAIVGPDGAGKTTLVRALAALPELDPLPIYLGVDRESATHALPTTRWLARRRRERALRAAAGPDGGVSGRTGGPPPSRSGGRRSWLRRLADLVFPLVAVPHELAEFGYRLLVGWRARRAGRTVLFDRFVTDSLVDVAVDGESGWRRLRAEVLAMLGRADLLLVLDAPGDVLYARKGEHDPRRLERVREEQRAVAARARRVVVIDATQPAERVLDLARDEIHRARAQRQPDA